jgi:hypothetical protein
MPAFEPLAAVVDLVAINPALEEMIERATGKGYPAPEFGHFGVPALGDDAAPVEVVDQLSKALQLKVAAEDDADGLGLSLVDDELLIPLVTTKGNRTAGPFAPAPAGGDLVPYPRMKIRIASLSLCF